MNLEALIGLSVNAGKSIGELSEEGGAALEATQIATARTVTETARSLLGDASPALAKEVERLEITPDQLAENDGIEALIIGALRRQKTPDALIQEARGLYAGIYRARTKEELPKALRDQPKTVRDVVQDDVPMLRNAELHGLIRLGNGARVGRALGVKDAVLQKIADAGEVFGEMSDAAIAELEKTGMDKADLEAVARMNDIGRLMDGNPRLTEIASKSTGNLSTTADLLALSAEAWTKLAQEAGDDDGIKRAPDIYGQLLRERVEIAHPTKALAQNLRPNRKKTEDAVQKLLGFQQKFKEQPIYGAPDLGRLGVEVDPEIRQAHSDMRRLINQFPGMALDKIMDEPDKPIEVRLEETLRRVGEARVFLDRNDEMLGLDLSTGSKDVDKLKFPDTSPEENAGLLRMARGYQRVHAIAETPDLTGRLMQAGAHSAVAIAHAGADGLTASRLFSEEEVDWVVARATEMAPNVIGAFGSVLDQHHDWFGGTLVGNTPNTVQTFLKDVPGYADFFGTQDYCTCVHCRSILSPAAYFVDLMRFIEEKISVPVFSFSRRDHPLFLGKRRPDLWTLPLSCENTEELIPTLEIVCEVLESYLAAETNFAGDMTDRAAVAQHAYGTLLPNEVDSFFQPLVLPHEEIKIFLSHYEMTLRDVVALTGGDMARRARMGLGVSAPELAQIITPQVNLNRLRNLFGVHFGGTAAVVNAFEAKDILPRSGLSRDALGQALASRFVTDDGALNIRIRGEKRSVQSVQNDIERVRGMNRASLDRLRRMTLLARALGWSFLELDVALEQGRDMGAPADFPPVVLTSLVGIDAIAKAHRIDLDEALALVSPMPMRATREDALPLMDRLFNTVPYQDAPRWPDAAQIVLLPAFAPENAPVDANLARLQAGLRLDDEGLTQLVSGLAPLLGADPVALTGGGQPDLAARSFALSHANLSRLYRYALLSRLLGQGTGQLVDLVALTPQIAGAELAGLADVQAVLTYAQALAASGREVADITFITGGTDTDTDGMAADIVASVTADEALLFPTGIFTVIEGVTDTASSAIIAANAPLFEDMGEVLRLAEGYDPAVPLVLPADDLAAGVQLPVTLRADPGLLQAALDPYHAPQVLVAELPGVLGVPGEVITAGLALLGADPGAAPLVRALRGDDNADAIAALLKVLAPVAQLLSPAGLTPVRLDFVAANAALFNINNPLALSNRAVLAVDRYAALVKNLRVADEDPALDAGLLGYVAGTGFAAADVLELARLKDCEPSLITGLQTALDLPNDPLAALSRLIDAVTVARRLSVNGAALMQAGSDDYATLQIASEAVQAGLRAKYDTEAEWEDKVEPYRDMILSRRRDGLVSFLLYSSAPEFKTVGDLYEYFLIDLEMEGCGRTSRVVSATAALQLYVQRITLNLEETPGGHADPVHVSPRLVDADDWSWRKNYRVWEANRRVFLYPENYLLPELRMNKTPLYEAFEEAMSANDINADTVRDAYVSYLSGLEVLSRMKVSGSFLEKDRANKADVLHLFGVTSEDPPRHFYRRIENFVAGITEVSKATNWDSWREVKADIGVRKVSPIVHQGRLYLFWTEVSTNPRQKITNGNALFTGYAHKFTLKFVTRRLDGSWSTPQGVKLDNAPFHFGDGVVVDEINEVRLGQYDGEGHPHYDGATFHKEPMNGYSLSGFAWDRVYPEHWDSKGEDLVVRGYDFRVNATLDLYELRLGQTLTSGVEDVRVPWVDPATALIGLLFGAPWFFPSSNMLWSADRDEGRKLYRGRSIPPFFTPYATGSLAIERENYYKISSNRAGMNYMLNGPGMTEDIIDSWSNTLRNEVAKAFDGPELITFDRDQPELSVMNGAPNHGIIDVKGALFALLDKVDNPRKYRLERLNSSVISDIARTLHTSGVDAMLDIKAQEALAEHPLPFDIVNARINGAPAHVGDMDYEGPMGVYLQEIFLHLPITIATQLNGQGDYDAAQRWYHAVFDPTASDEITNLPAGLSAAEQKRRKLDRTWRYRRFRNLAVESLRDMLENDAAIEVYKNDPFNPHAIARLRISAYQKYVVLAYVDNLMDWADSLFATDLREQIAEAEQLYVMALDILGQRPVKLGDCGELIGAQLSFEQIEDRVVDDDELLLEIETAIIGRRRWRGGGGTLTGSRPDVRDSTWSAVDALRKKGVDLDLMTPAPDGFTLDSSRDVATLLQGKAKLAADVKRGLRDADAVLARAVSRDMAESTVSPFGKPNDRTARTARTRSEATGITNVAALMPQGEFADGARVNAVSSKNRILGKYAIREKRGIVGAGGGMSFVPGFGISITRQINPVFCIPENEKLGKFWDRVEDRLFKIHNCMNIDGVKRPLALFAPRIDPAMLVRARAAGLSLDDILGSNAAESPPFRFRFLLERARAAVGLTQSLGGALQAALSGHSAEEFGQLRNLHQANLLELNKGLREIEIKSAETGIEELVARRVVLDEKRSHYASLLSTGDLPAEAMQKAAKMAAKDMTLLSSLLKAGAAIAHAVPNFGAPTTMEYGGSNVGPALEAAAAVVSFVAEGHDKDSVSAGMIAGTQRRNQGWAHQLAMAERELEAIVPREEAAGLRLEQARKGLDIHKVMIEQNDEVIEFYGDKFNNLELYSYLSGSLQKLYRRAFNIAQGYARLAENAYRFETGEDVFTITGPYWESAKAGLLAGEKLMLDLAALEQRYIEGKRRSMEINQTFSLSQLDPAALMQLKATGGANFSLPEWAFDLFYPGQYKRRIKAVRLTLPSIAGPYTNISATLALTESFIRNDASGAGALNTAPRSRDAMVATSTAQSDAGVFELSFRDERYLPFEGAGAISSWRLDLPSNFRPFSYDSISDVLLNISYEAEYDAGLRTLVEDENSAAGNALAQVLGAQTQRRVISLRQEASTTFQRLASSAPGTAVALNLSDMHFPLFLRGRQLNVARVLLALQPEGAVTPLSTEMSLNGKPGTGFAADPDFGGQFVATVATPFNNGLFGAHDLVITTPGEIAPQAGAGAVDFDRLKDIQLIIEYTVGGPIV
ncbi:neuraminidase-like domain-containing protein [Sulfitobacter sp. F26169L]|uniref:Tc toxin subunit A-related protein n=1 Tax=Sulfitobacter sp. F26169L TaxID=2996015 RepID=UPI002260F751|nr:neuraminidase-like domain-containing protein [Sulfitobacter sp. F26169L]MCX7568167.1 neuraminidase-like domain-containing protein [Sulfitobacter sp. F26169L]